MCSGYRSFCNKTKISILQFVDKAMSDSRNEDRVILGAIETLRQDLQKLNDDIQLLKGTIISSDTSRTSQSRVNRKFLSLETLAIILPFVGLVLGLIFYFSSVIPDNSQTCPTQETPSPVQERNP